MNLTKLSDRISLWIYKSHRGIDLEYRGTVCFDDVTANQEKIEPRIRSLVLEMHHSGHFKTIASCQGHINYFPYPHIPINKPYVFFKAKEPMYEALFKQLRDEGYAPIKLCYGFAKPSLTMHPELGVCMGIDLEYGRRWVNRKQMDLDIARLSDILDDAVFLADSEAGEKKIPKA